MSVLLVRFSALLELQLQLLDLRIVDGPKGADVRQRVLVFLRQGLHLPQDLVGQTKRGLKKGQV